MDRLFSGDYLIFIDLKVYMDSEWSSAVSEDFFTAVSKVFNVILLFSVENSHKVNFVP